MNKKLLIGITAASICAMACVAVGATTKGIKLNNVQAESEYATFTLDATHNLPTASGVEYQAVSSNGAKSKFIVTCNWDSYTIGGGAFVTSCENS